MESEELKKAYENAWNKYESLKKKYIKNPEGLSNLNIDHIVRNLLNYVSGAIVLNDFQMLKDSKEILKSLDIYYKLLETHEEFAIEEILSNGYFKDKRNLSEEEYIRYAAKYFT